MGFSSGTLCSIIFFAVILISQLQSRWLNRHRQLSRMPPGPRGLPIIGNLHQVTADYQERTFARWAKNYGNLIYARFFTRPVLIINTQRIARDLLDKRGSKYSSRPRLVLMCEVLGLHGNTALREYDDERRRKQRRWIQRTFGDKPTIEQVEMLQREVSIMVDGLMHAPNHFALHVKRYTSALIMESVYGHRIVSLEDEFIFLVDIFMEGLATTGPAGGALVDFIPLLKYAPAWMPGMGWKRYALYLREVYHEGTTRPYIMARDKLLAGTARPSYVSALVEEAVQAGNLIEEEEEDIRESAYALYGAGTDTTKSVILTFVLAMVIYPNVYLKAQLEIDQIIGKDRLPTLADRDLLPYVDCIIKEAYRWHPPVPLGIPHYLTEDDEYRGLNLPKNTTVIANLWSMCRAEDVYDDSEVFRPERFMGQGLPDPMISDPRNIVFGHGRRLCPGRQFGDAAVFLAIANVIATLNINKARDVQGREITPEPRFTSGFTSQPFDFVCDIEPHSSATVKLIADAVVSVS